MAAKSAPRASVGMALTLTGPAYARRSATLAALRAVAGLPDVPFPAAAPSPAMDSATWLAAGEAAVAKASGPNPKPKAASTLKPSSTANNTKASAKTNG